MDIVGHFVRIQSSVVMRAARMEIASYKEMETDPDWLPIISPWSSNAHLQAKLDIFKKGLALQALLEHQIVEASTYLNEPTEVYRDQFVTGLFKAIYASEAYRYGDKAILHLTEVADALALSN